MKAKKVIVLLVCLVMTASLFGGCGGKVKYDPDNFLPNGTADNPWQIVKDPITIKVFVPKHPMHSNYRDMASFKKLSEITNIRFDFVEAAVGSYSSLRTVVWENKKELPDLFLFLNTVSEQMSLAEYGAIVPLNDDTLTVTQAGHVGNLLDSCMPHYKALLESNFLNTESSLSATKLATLPDGKMYSVVCYSDVPRDNTYKMYLNTEWIENLNTDPALSYNLTKDPQTVEEYIEILRAFKREDANRNGDKNDEIPVSAVALENFSNFILQAYGYVNEGVEIDGDRFVYVPETNAYREYLKTMRLLFSEGLLDNSTFEMTSGTAMAGKGYAGKLGSFVDAAAYLTVGKEYDKQYDTIGPITSGYIQNAPTCMNGIKNMFAATGSLIPSTTPYVREIARLLDYLYTDEGARLMLLGEEGVHWSWDDEAQTQWTFHVPDDFTGTTEEYRATLSANVGTGCALYNPYSFEKRNSDATMKEVNRQAERYEGKIKYAVPEGFVMNEEDEDRAAIIQASLMPYVRNMRSNFITGKNNAESDADWEEYLKTVRAYNSAELIGLYNKYC